jgi:putative PIN family toxin of toxin-antitoxin system
MSSEPLRIVIDTNVLVAASRSQQGASFALISSIPSAKFQICLSVSLYAEWMDVLSRPENLPAGLTVDDAQKFVRYLAATSHLQEIHFLWRPFLSDSDDDMVLELALAADCECIITHNTAHFRGANELGIEVLTPIAFLKRMNS